MHTVAGMRNLRLWTSLISVSIFALLVLRHVPGTWLIDVRFANLTVGYVVLGLIFYLAVYFLAIGFGVFVCAKDQKRVEPVSLGPPQALASSGFPS